MRPASHGNSGMRATRGMLVRCRKRPQTHKYAMATDGTAPGVCPAQGDPSFGARSLDDEGRSLSLVNDRSGLRHVASPGIG
jgi:hypothetical protein